MRLTKTQTEQDTFISFMEERLEENKGIVSDDQLLIMESVIRKYKEGLPESAYDNKEFSSLSAAYVVHLLNW